jgi:hypothetical protein
MNGELNTQSALSHFIHLMRTPLNDWEQYLKVAQVQLVQEVCHTEHSLELVH